MTQNPKHPTAEVAVRINKAGQSPRFDELEQLARVSQHIDAIVLPKFSRKGYNELVHFIDKHFHKGTEESRKVYKIWALVETPNCLVNLQGQLYSLAKDQFSHSRLRGMIFGAEDYAQSSAITRTPSLTELLYPRQQLVAICKAWHLECLDLVSTNFRDMDTLRAECQQGSQFGFTGKQAIHPTQIPIIHEAFSPSKESVDHAERLLEKYIAEESGDRRGAWEFEGKMIDRPVVLNAIRVLRLAFNYNVVPDKAKSEEIITKAEKQSKEQSRRNQDVTEG